MNLVGKTQLNGTVIRVFTEDSPTGEKCMIEWRLIKSRNVVKIEITETAERPTKRKRITRIRHTYGLAAFNGLVEAFTYLHNKRETGG